MLFLWCISGKTYPDFLGCFICLGMTIVLAAGVKNSVIFNNILNGINFAVWLFMLFAGFFFMDGSIWRETGFAPYGTSGVREKGRGEREREREREREEGMERETEECEKERDSITNR